MTDKLKGTLIGVAAIVVLAGGGAAIAGAAGGQQGHKRNDHAEGRGNHGDKRDDHGDKRITGGALVKASQVALARTGGGRVTDTEIGDEEGYYEVEVSRTDGSQVDVHLDRDFKVLDASPDGPGDAHGRSEG